MMKINLDRSSLIHHQGIICGVAFARSSLRRIARYASVVAPRCLASDALLVIRNFSKPSSRLHSGNLTVDLGSCSSSATCTRACSRFSRSAQVSAVSLLRCYLHLVCSRFNRFSRALFSSLQCQLHWAGFHFTLSCQLPSSQVRRHLRRVWLLSCPRIRQS
jgi:hypothetical protein